MSRVVLGCERLLAAGDLIRGRRVGLITNHSGVDVLLQSTADRLHQSDLCTLVALYGPEHGIRGAAQDGEHIAHSTDHRTGVPTYSLYGQVRAPDAAMLAGVELMLFDIQDVGARFYTYLYTMSLSMAVCAQAGIPFLVLDRPNPIGGQAIAGNCLDPAFASFVGQYPIPVRYGLTIGELARLFNEEYGIGAELHIVAMKGWQRSFYWGDTGLPWVPPSPNMPSPETAGNLSGNLFLRTVTNVSEGRGTAKPFEQFGAPFIDGARLADALNSQALAWGGLPPRCFFSQRLASTRARRARGFKSTSSTAQPSSLSALALRRSRSCVGSTRANSPGAYPPVASTTSIASPAPTRSAAPSTRARPVAEFAGPLGPRRAKPLTLFAAATWRTLERGCRARAIFIIVHSDTRYARYLSCPHRSKLGTLLVRYSCTRLARLRPRGRAHYPLQRNRPHHGPW